MYPLLLTFFLIFLFTPTFASTQIEISEKYLDELSKKGSPRIDQIQAAFLETNVRKGQVEEEFAPELFGRTSYAETNEKPIIQFIPIFSPIKQAQLGVRKDLTNGFTAEAAVTTDQRSSSSQTAGKFQNVTTTTLSFSMQMDLWKDLFGRMSKAKLENVALDTQRAQLEKDIQMKAFKLSLRKIYWSLVANQEAMKISEELLKTAQRQAAETTRRFKNSVAEADEVARYSAQVASRQSTLLYLQYQKETLIRQLKNLLPELSSSEIVLEKYDLEDTFNQVMACTSIIAKEQNVPYQNTHYDELTNVLRKVKNTSSLINSRYADPDVKLYGTVKSTGVGSESTSEGFRGSYGTSIDDMTATNRSGYEVGLKFNVPLGDVKKLNQNTKELYDEKRLLAAINDSDIKVISTHQHLVKSISLLNSIITSQNINSEQLGIRLKFVQKKYEQARASVNDLVQDQDALLNSQLSTIDTKTQILSVLFDYLAIYTETPCPFNRI